MRKNTIRTDGYYMVQHSGTGFYENHYEITMFLFFNRLNRVYFTENEGHVDLSYPEAESIIKQLKNITDTDHEIAEFQIAGSNIDMIFYRDNKRLDYFQFKGIIKGDHLMLDWINQTLNRITNEIEKTVDLTDLKFKFVKC